MGSDSEVEGAMSSQSKEKDSFDALLESLMKDTDSCDNFLPPKEEQLVNEQVSMEAQVLKKMTKEEIDKFYFTITTDYGYP